MRRTIDLSVYLVTDARLCGAAGVIAVVQAAVEGGVTAVQLRDPQAPARALVAQARALRAWLRPRGIALIINDRADIALAADADGVHVGQDDLAPGDVRAQLGPDRIVGLSVGNLAELAASSLDGVDYLGVGPVYGTATKADAGAAIGPQGLAQLRSVVGQDVVDIVGIGGIGETNAAPVIRAGAKGVAVVSAVCGAADPRAAAQRIAAAVRAARPQAR